MTSTTAVAILNALDQGRFTEHLALLDQPTGDDPGLDLARAELLLWLDRISECEALAESLAGVSLDRALEERRTLILAECCLWNGAAEACRDVAARVAAAGSDDASNQVRSLLLPARASVSRAEYGTAFSEINGAILAAKALRLDHWLGIGHHVRAYALWKLNQHESAIGDFSEALRVFVSTGNVRWEGVCRTVYGLYLLDTYRAGEAWVEFEAADEIARRVGVIRDELWAKSAAVFGHLARRRYDEALRIAGPVLEWQRIGQVGGRAEGALLVNCSLAAGMLGDWDTARRAAAEALTIAELIRNADMILDATMLTLWADLGALGAEVNVNPARIQQADRALLDLIEELQPDQGVFEIRAKILRANALRAVRPVEASWAVGELLSQRVRDAEFAEVLAVTAEDLAGGLIQVTETAITFRIGGQWPSYDKSVDALKRFLLFSAERAADGNRAKAGELLSLSRSRYHDQWHVLRGDPVRPVKGAREKRTNSLRKE